MRRRTVILAGAATAGVATLSWTVWPADEGHEGEVERPRWRLGEDDAAFINDKLRSAQPGDEVRLPYLSRGYAIGSTLRIPHGVALRCDPTSPIRAVADLRSMVTIQGPRARLTGANLQVGSWKVASIVKIASSAPNAVLEACHLDGDGGANIGVQAHGPRIGTTVTDCVIEGAATGISLIGSGRSVLIAGTEITAWSQRGIYVQQRGAAPFVRVTIRDNSVHDMHIGGDSRYPIVVTGTERRKTRHLAVRGNAVTGVDHSYRDPTFAGTADQIAVRHARTVDVSGNTSTGGGEVGITVAHSHDGQVRNNLAKNNDAAGIYIGTRENFSMGRILVEGNRCENNGKNRQRDRPRRGRVGIRVSDGGRVTLRKNVLADTQAQRTQVSGVTLDDGPVVKLEGNVFHGVATNVIRAEE